MRSLGHQCNVEPGLEFARPPALHDPEDASVTSTRRLSPRLPPASPRRGSRHNVPRVNLHVAAPATKPAPAGAAGPLIASAAFDHLKAAGHLAASLPPPHDRRAAMTSPAFVSGFVPGLAARPQPRARARSATTGPARAQATPPRRPTPPTPPTPSTPPTPPTPSMPPTPTPAGGGGPPSLRAPNDATPLRSESEVRRNAPVKRVPRRRRRGARAGEEAAIEWDKAESVPLVGGGEGEGWVDLKSGEREEQRKMEGAERLERSRGKVDEKVIEKLKQEIVQPYSQNWIGVVVVVVAVLVVAFKVTGGFDAIPVIPVPDL